MYELFAPASFPRDALRNRPQTLWRYREALPLPWPALPGSRLKLEFLLPTGSFKDPGAGLMLSHVKGLGVRSAVEDSSGNAATAVAPAGALRLAAAGGLPVWETTVIPLTGSGLKAGTTIVELLRRQPR